MPRSRKVLGLMASDAPAIYVTMPSVRLSLLSLTLCKSPYKAVDVWASASPLPYSLSSFSVRSSGEPIAIALDQFLPLSLFSIEWRLYIYSQERIATIRGQRIVLWKHAPLSPPFTITALL